MRDLGVLKERIEFAERHLKAAHNARERESEALMAMWRQIRDRFEAQEEEIARYRSDLAEMTQTNDELSALVDRLIASVEGSVHASASETVPEVAGMASELLYAETPRRGARPARAPEPPPAPAPRAARSSPAPRAAAPDQAALAAMETDDPLDLGTPLDDPDPAEAHASFASLLNRQAARDDDSDAPDDGEFDIASDDDDEEDGFDLPPAEAIKEKSGSPGIRDLISRIEGAVSGDSRRVRETEASKRDSDLDRDLQEIESLRNELSGLRDKISAGR